MADVGRIKRRATGSPGAPATLANAELAFNEVDLTLYYGLGTGGSGGSATTVIAIGGSGGFLTLSGAQTVTGAKTFSGSVSVPTVATADNSTNAATTAWVNLQGFLKNNQTIILSGDVTGSGTTAITTTLATSGVTAGSYGSATAVATNTVDAKGRVTAAASVAIAFPVTSVFGRTGAVVLTSGDVTGALGYTPINPSLIGAASGLATLDATGKLTAAQIPSSLLGAVVYQGVWNASTNTPTLVSSTGTKGQYYKVSTAGSTALDGISSWNVGDTVIFDGTTWDKIDGIANEVISVNGFTGVISLTTTNIAEGTNLYYTTARAASAAPVQSVNSLTGAVVLTTTNIAEGSNLYFTNARAAAAAPVQSVAGRTGAVVLSTTDIGGLGTMATQSAAAVAITGGTIDGITFDFGTF